jgi:membrane protease YdiL (CAAX protease family)
MSRYQFGRILLVNCLISIGINGLFYWQTSKSILSQRPVALLAGLVVYCAQVGITYYILDKQRSWLSAPFRGKAIWHGLGALLALQLLIILLLTSLSSQAQAVDFTQQLASFLPVFLLNTLPGALIEEWLFRYLPFRFGNQSTGRYRSILVCLGTLILFTVIHIPAYLLQYNLALTELNRVFIMGLFFLAIYLLTRNVIFTALIHGLTNNPLVLVESPHYWLYFYSSVVTVSLLWGLIRNWRRSVVV